MRALIDILYMVIGIGIIGGVLIVGIVGIVKIWRDTNKPDTEE
jgi:ABC-type uncharacterized transport system permease subunit